MHYGEAESCMQASDLTLQAVHQAAHGLNERDNHHFVLAADYTLLPLDWLPLVQLLSVLSVRHWCHAF